MKCNVRQLLLTIKLLECRFRIGLIESRCIHLLRIVCELSICSFSQNNFTVGAIFRAKTFQLELNTHAFMYGALCHIFIGIRVVAFRVSESV